MTIDATSAASAATTTTSAATPGLQGTKDEFLKLFMAQLQHQDPLDPSSNADMVAQLAQFSSVEQATQTNDQLSQLVAAQASSSSANLSNLVGRTCDADLGTATVKDPSAVPPIEVSSTAAIQGASVVITGPDGKEVRRIAIPAGGGTIQWDGRDASGKLLSPGSYTFSIDAGTSTAPITARFHGRIDGVALAADGSYLDMGGLELTPSSIRTIGAAAPVSTTASTTASSAISAAQGVLP